MSASMAMSASSRSHGGDTTEEDEGLYVAPTSASSHRLSSSALQHYQSASRQRAPSVVSLSSSSLTDPDELEISVATSSHAKPSASKSKKKLKRATSSSAGSITSPDPATSAGEESEIEDLDDEDLDDGFLEVNKDGTDRPLTRIKKLLSRSPGEPKHRWETAYVYAFIERFTSVQKDSPYAPQTIFEFETALERGRGLVVPDDADDAWIPSLEPIFRDFIDRIKRADKVATGGTTGPKGGWLQWLPWWVSEQRALGSPDFASGRWEDIIQAMRVKDDRDSIFKIMWDRKLIVLKALVDFQICLCDDVKTYINDTYGYVSTYKPQTKEEKEAKAKAKAEAKEAKDAKQQATASTSTAPLVVDKPAVAKEKGKEKEKGPPVPESVNPLVIRPIGTDTLKQVWFTVDDSPRIWVNSNPYQEKQAFVAVSDTVEEIEELLSGLQSAPLKPVEPEPIQGTSKLEGPFAKAKAQAENAKGKDKKADKGKVRDQTKKRRKKTAREVLAENEELLHAHIRDVILPLLKDAETSPYFQRKAKLETRRVNYVKKVQREARLETLAAQREANLDTGAGSFRSSTRLRRGGRNPTNYDERARDQEIEAAIQESEKRKRRRFGSDAGSDEDDYNDRHGANGHSETDEDGSDMDEDEDGVRLRRPRRAGRNGTGSSRAVIPGERRSTRQQMQHDRDDRSVSPPVVTSRRAAIVRSNSPDLDMDEPEEAQFGGLEEVWSKGQYKGYYRPDRTFIKAQKGDIPLYKLAKMGLPLPPLSGPLPERHPNGIDGAQSSRGGALATSNGSAESARADLEELSIPGSAVPTLEAETDGRDTDDSIMMVEDTSVLADDDDSDAPVVVTSRRADIRAEVPASRDHSQLRKPSSRVEVVV